MSENRMRSGREKKKNVSNTGDVFRVRVAGIVVESGRVLVQQPVDNPGSCFAFIGGEYEVGDTLEARLRMEFEEETNARIVATRYLFCVENAFVANERVVRQVEHYFKVQLDRHDVVSREPDISHHWLRVSSLATVDLRPLVVRDALINGSYLNCRHMIQSLAC